MDAPERVADLGMLTGQLMRAIQEELFEKLAEQGHPTVRPRHGSVLAFLGPEGARATDISARSGQHKQVVGTIVDELVGLGYVTREPDPDDRRAKRVVPTELGLDEITKARATLTAIEHRHAKDLGVRSFAAFKATLQEITRNQLNWRRADPDEPAA
ncbi:MarR family winged helix-turn-helix transcriptional regulator [Micromonospora azadirachtae]|uniref:MarR family winged helix-turn-helix transcriptional regulator n=1 Tax=Micromonospora azadirachtae TaxID=1970735 RepID=A0ABW3A121_9ACTN